MIVEFVAKPHPIRAVQWTGDAESIVALERLVKAHLPTRCVVRKEGTPLIVVIVQELQIVLPPKGWLMYRELKDEYFGMSDELRVMYYDQSGGVPIIED